MPFGIDEALEAVMNGTLEFSKLRIKGGKLLRRMARRKHRHDLKHMSARLDDVIEFIDSPKILKAIKGFKKTHPFLGGAAEKLAGLQGGMERLMIGNKNQISVKEARAIAKNVAGKSLPREVHITKSPIMGSHFDPIGRTIETQPFPALVAHEARHAKQAGVIGDIAAAGVGKIPWVQRSSLDIEGFTKRAAPVAVFAGGNIGADRIAPMVKNKAIRAALQVPRLVTEADANIAALKYPGGPRLAAASMGSYVNKAVKNYRTKQLGSVLDDIIQFGPLWEGIKKGLRKNGSDIAAKNIGKNWSLGQKALVAGVGFGGTLYATNEIPFIPGVPKAGGFARIEKVLELAADPRPRNQLGQFAGTDAEGVANPNAMAITYRQPIVNNVAQGAAGGASAAAGGLALKALYDKIKSAQLANLSARLDEEIQFGITSALALGAGVHVSQNALIKAASSTAPGKRILASIFQAGVRHAKTGKQVHPGILRATDVIMGPEDSHIYRGGLKSNRPSRLLARLSSSINSGAAAKDASDVIVGRRSKIASSIINSLPRSKINTKKSAGVISGGLAALGAAAVEPIVPAINIARTAIAESKIGKKVIKNRFLSGLAHGKQPSRIRSAMEDYLLSPSLNKVHAVGRGLSSGFINGLQPRR